jgi:hypothetical protein
VNTVMNIRILWRQGYSLISWATIRTVLK